jgi:IrrE N-terminal-like domain
MAVVAPYLPYDKLRVVAADFHEQHHPSGEIPIPIERIIEFRFQLDIVPVPGIQDEFDVDAYITSDLREIRVDRFIQASRPARYRFSLAHELSHLLIHQEVFKELKFSSIKDWKSAICSIPEEQYGWIEWQAYSLGGLILVPPQPLKDLFETRCEEAMRAGIDLQEVDDRMRRVIESNIGRHFEVSAEVIARRMKYDKMWK